MRAGKLRQQILIYGFTSALDSYGQETKTWTLKATVRAEVKTLSETEGENTGQADAKTYLDFFMCYTVITKADRIVWDSRNWSVIEVINVMQNKKELKVRAYADG